MPSGNTLVNAWQNQDCGKLELLFTDAGAMLIMKYLQGCSRKPPILVPAFDGTAVVRAVVRNLWAQKESLPNPGSIKVISEKWDRGQRSSE